MLLVAMHPFVMATPTQYYVSPTGSDVSGNGTITQPWQTIQHAMYTIPFANDNVDLNLRGGRYVLQNTIYFSEERGGSEFGTFRLKSFANENAILDGSLIPEKNNMIHISSASYISIEGLEITNLTGHKTGIKVEGDSSHIRIYQNEIHNMHWTNDEALKAQPRDTNNLNPLVVLGNKISPSTAISIVENDIYNLTTGYSEAIKIVGNVDGFLVEGNDVFDVANICIVVAGNYSWVRLSNPELNHARNGIIRYNNTFRCKSPIAASAGIYVDGGRDIYITHNNSHHNDVGYSVGSEQLGDASGIVLNRNTAISNSQAGIVIGTITPGAHVKDVVVTENQIKKNYTQAVFGGAPIVLNAASSVTINNNELLSNSEFMLTVNFAVTNLNIDYNQYISTAVNAEDAEFNIFNLEVQRHVGFQSYQNASGLDKNSSFTYLDPLSQ